MRSRRTATLTFITLLIGAFVVTGPARAAGELKSVGDPSVTPTFESAGIIVPFAGDDDRDLSCALEYRRAGDSKWKNGHDLWVDHRTERRDSRECRGSLVHLEPGTGYEIRVSLSDPDGGSATRRVETTTWSEGFSAGEVVEVEDRTAPLEITESGRPGAYRVFRPPEGETSTIDAGNEYDHNVVVSASYVVVSGFDLTGASDHAVVIEKGVHDVVIEDCEITQWGPSGIGGLNDWNWRSACAIYGGPKTERLVVQHNRIHDPRGGSNSWEDGPEPRLNGEHPMGPQAVSFNQTAGNHVIRYNAMYAEGERHRYNDVLGGARNAGTGNLYRDSDVYGNFVNHAFDDGLEIEGYNMNIRVWGNVITDTMKSIATANIGYHNAERDNSLGPQYMWRNLIKDNAPPYPSATKIRGNGGYYFYHNTIIDAGLALEAPRQDKHTDVTNLKMVGVVKNNIILTGSYVKRSDSERYREAAARWHFDYNLYPERRKEVGVLRDNWERDGVFGSAPAFERKGDHVYYLAPGDPGVDAGDEIPNFNDRFAGDGPDMGAFERHVFPPRDWQGYVRAPE